MPSAPFLGAGMGRMFENATEGVAQGNLNRMLLDRQDRQFNDQMALKREALDLSNENKRAASVQGFIKGAVNFYKATGDAEATKQFWNQNAQQYGLQPISAFQPIDNQKMQVHFENGQGVLINKGTGVVQPLTTQGGQTYQAPRTVRQQAYDLAAQRRMDLMTDEDQETANAAAGVRTPAARAGKTMTPMQAMKRKTELLTRRVKLLKGNEMDALLASINPGYQPGAGVDEKTKQAVDAQIEAETAELDKIIAGGESGSQRAGAGQSGTGSVNPLAGRPPGRYRLNGQVVRWDGSKVVQ